MFDLLVPAINLLSSPDLRSSIESSVPPILSECTGSRGLQEEGAIQDPGRTSDTWSADTGIVAKLTEESRAMSVGDQRAVTRQILSRSAEEASRLRQERLRQARLSFNVGLTLVIVGVLIIFAGVGLMIAGIISAGIVGSIIGSICNVMSLIVFRFNKQANDRLDQVNADIGVLETASLAMTLIDEIEDPKSRDRALGRAVTALTATASRRKVVQAHETK